MLIELFSILAFSFVHGILVLTVLLTFLSYRRSSCVLSTQKGVEYSLTYRIDGVVYELFNDCQFLYP